MFQRRKIDNREDWLAARMNGIGGSEAAAVVGLSPWLSAVDLWKIKVGNAQPKDLSDSDLIQKGKRLEPVLREWFTAMYPEFTVEYHEFDLLYQSERPWLYSTLDAELIDENGHRGILEIKTATPSNREAWQKWNDQIPAYYMTQICHQLLSTGYDYVFVLAALTGLNGDTTIKQPYYFERSDLAPEMEWLLEEETKFWKCVCEKRMPGMKLVL